MHSRDKPKKERKKPKKSAPKAQQRKHVPRGLISTLATAH